MDTFFRSDKFPEGVEVSEFLVTLVGGEIHFEMRFDEEKIDGVFEATAKILDLISEPKLRSKNA